MLLSELSNEVNLLGYNTSTEDEGLFFSCVNRALRDLFAGRTITKNVTLAATGVKPISYIREIQSKSGEMVRLPAYGKAFSMRVHGTVTYSVKDGNDVNTYTVDSPNEATLVKAFLTYGGIISLWGQFSFTIYDYSVYDQIFTQNLNDIPHYGPTVTFNLREIYGDFMSFVSPAKDRNGKAISGCILYDGRVEVDSSYRGEIFLSYRRLPSTVCEPINSDDIQMIDIPTEYTHIFPLLVASYLFAGEDEVKAKYYRQLYDEGLELIDSCGYKELDYGYIDTNGWA